MKHVRRENTAPELAVRRFLHAQGLRYSLHARHLPGTPDLMLPRRGTVVFVHGCFWHGHDCSHGKVRAKTNTLFWDEKLSRNRARDASQQSALRALGWKVEVIWECEASDAKRLSRLGRKLLRR